MAKMTKPLTATQVEKARNTDKAYKLTDGGGLYLFVSTTGVKSWRIDYSTPLTKKRVTMTLGKYPELSLAQARMMRADIKSTLAVGVDPRQKKKNEERQELLEMGNTFAMIAEEYIQRQDHLAPATQVNNRRHAEYLNEFIGATPINHLKPIDILDACRAAEARGHLEKAKKMRSMAGRVFRYAVATARTERDITQDLRGALKTPQTKHYPAVIDPVEFGHILRAIDSYKGLIETQSALKLFPMLFVRSGEMRHALWSDFNFEEKTWTFTPRKTKRKTGLSLVVPLPKQAIEIFMELQKHRRSDYVFPALHSVAMPMSDSTFTQALRRLGISGDTQSIHGFRASARTMLAERLRYPDRLIEMQLGHKVRDVHGHAYNRATFLDERTEMMQAWADYLDELKADDPGA